MVRFKELSKLSQKERKNKLNELKLDLIKARVTASKGGKTKIREMKKTIAKLNMLGKSNNS
jgi:ribosomal protein L29